MSAFAVTHATHLHPPYGLYIVRHRGVVIGRQLSVPSDDDCRHMLRVHREGKQKLAFAGDRLAKNYGRHLDGPDATTRSQRRGGINKRTTLKLRTA